MKKKIVMALMATVITASSFGATGLTAQAADVMVPGVTVASTENATAQKVIFDAVFDAEYYASAYPDVVAVVGTDAKALYAHYLTCGINEGRNASATFNLDAYIAANPDLVAVYGTDSNNVIDYFIHYTGFGVNEGRIATIDAATAAGITVTSHSDDTKVIAAPTTAKYVASSNGSSSSVSLSGSSASSSSSTSSSSASTTSSSASTSADTSSSVTTVSESSAAQASNSADEGVTYRYMDWSTGEWVDGIPD